MIWKHEFCLVVNALCWPFKLLCSVCNPNLRRGLFLSLSWCLLSPSKLELCDSLGALDFLNPPYVALMVVDIETFWAQKWLDDGHVLRPETPLETSGIAWLPAGIIAWLPAGIQVRNSRSCRENHFLTSEWKSLQTNITTEKVSGPPKEHHKAMYAQKIRCSCMAVCMHIM